LFFEASCETIIKRDLSDPMFSQVKSEKHLGDLIQVTQQVTRTLVRGEYNPLRDLIEEAAIDEIISVTTYDGDTVYNSINYELFEEYIDWASTGVGPAADELYQLTYTKRVYEYEWDNQWDVTLYDVPLIQKAYYLSKTSQFDSDFELQIVQKVVDFDVVNYRMLTDFVNLKFANTTGKLTNMLYNTKLDPVVDINPNTFPISPEDGQRWAVTTKDNPWVNPVSIYYQPTRNTGFIAQWSQSGNNWLYYYLSVNEMFLIESEDTIYTFNGEILVNPVLNIPFEVNAIVWRDTTENISSTTLATTIKEVLIDTFFESFGYDVNIYRSEIIRAIQAVRGVSHCELLNPAMDVQFNFDIYKEFTQLQLLEYTPDLVYFDTQVIDLEIR